MITSIDTSTPKGLSKEFGVVNLLLLFNISKWFIFAVATSAIFFNNKDTTDTLTPVISSTLGAIGSLGIVSLSLSLDRWRTPNNFVLLVLLERKTTIGDTPIQTFSKITPISTAFTCKDKVLSSQWKVNRHISPGCIGDSLTNSFLPNPPVSPKVWPFPIFKTHLSENENADDFEDKILLLLKPTPNKTLSTLAIGGTDTSHVQIPETITHEIEHVLIWVTLGFVVVWFANNKGFKVSKVPSSEISKNFVFKDSSKIASIMGISNASIANFLSFLFSI